MTIHGPQSTYDAPGAFNDPAAVTTYANAVQFQKAAALEGMNVSVPQAAAMVSSWAKNESGFQNGQPGIDAGALNPSSYAVGLAQDLSTDRLAGMINTVAKNAGVDPSTLSRQSFTDSQGDFDAKGWASAIGDAPGSLYSQMQYAAHEIATNPAYSPMKAALTAPQTNDMDVAKAFTAYEGATTPAKADYASYVNKSADAIRTAENQITAIGYSVPGTAPYSGPSPSYSSTPDAPASADPATTAGYQTMSPDQKTAYAKDHPDQRDPNSDPKSPTTFDGTPLGGVDPSTAADTEKKGPSINPAITNGVFDAGAGLLGGPIGLGLAGLNTVSGWLGGPTVGSMTNSALANMSPGVPAGSLGSNNSRGINSASNNTPAAPPAKGGRKASDGQAKDHLKKRPAPDPTPPPSWYSPIPYALQAPTVADQSLYDPMRDPAVLRALGYAA